MGTSPVTLFGIILLIIGLVMLFKCYKCEKENAGELALYFIGGCVVGVFIIAGII